MDPSSVQRHQDIMSSQSLDSMFMCTKSENEQQQEQQQQQQQQQQQEKKARPADEQALKCPRCDSSNTKFCYYNNYSLTQPRYFCKSCRRYWTKGGTLRNVPVGGGCRKNKRCSSSSRRSNTPDHIHNLITSPTSSSSHSQHLISPLTSYDHHNNHAHDLTLASFAHHHQHGNLPILGNSGNTHFDLFGNHFTGSLLDSLRSGLVHHDNNNNNNNNNNGLNLYYGGNLGDVENGGGNNVNNNNNVTHHENHHHDQMGMQFDLLHHHQNNGHQDIMSNASSGASTPTIKQELGDSRSVFLNYIMGGGGGGGGGSEMDHAPRESWNAGVLGSSWHNLINSPLM